MARQLLDLMRLRSTHPAFGGHFDLLPGPHDNALTLRWSAGTAQAELNVDFTTLSHTLRFTAA